MQLDQVPRNRQTQADPAVGALDAPVGLPKRLEDMREKTGIDPPAGIAHRDFHGRLELAQHDVDAPPFGRKLHGVADQVPHDLLQSARVARDGPLLAFDDALKDLVERNQITGDTAYMVANKKEDFEPFVSEAFLKGAAR